MKCTTIAAMILIPLLLLAGCGGGGGVSADATQPAFVNAVITGNKLVLTYGEALDAVNIPAASAFTVKVNGTSVSLASAGAVEVNSAGKTVTLTLAAPVYATDTVLFSYTDPTAGNDINAIQDIAGNDVASLGEQAVTNTSPPDTTNPAFVGAVITGNTLVLSYGEALDAVHIPAASAFIVTVNGTPVSLVSVGAVVVNSAGKTVTLTLAAPVYSTDIVTFSYTDPTTANDINAIQDIAGNDVASLGGQAVTNGAAPIAKGFWGGTTGAVTTSAIVLANGDSWFVFIESGVISRFARLQIIANGTNYSSTGYQYLLQSGTKETAAATGTFSEKLALSAFMTAVSGTTTLTNLAFNTRYETAAVQADATGSWTGSFGGNSSSRTMNIAATGALTGTSTTGCSYSGTILPRTADPAVFDANFTETCVIGSPTVLSGIATVNAAKTSLSMAVTTADKASGALFMGQKL